MSKPSLVQSLQVAGSMPIRLAIAAIDRSRRLGIALVVDSEERLVNTLTDGDVRRGILAGFTLEDPITCLLEIKKRMPRSVPVVAEIGSSREQLIQLMRDNKVRQLPLVHDGRVYDIVALHELWEEAKPEVAAVVMAGGLGKRLYPLTENLPKPMLPVGGKPLLEILVQRLCASGIRDLHVTTHYKPEKITEHFGDGASFGVNISYVNETSPLGTAGALGLLQRPAKDLLVINGDILTQLDFGVMFEFHRQHRAAMTVAVRPYQHVVPFGVVKIEDSRITGIAEKPRHTWFVSAGIYILSPSVFDHVRPGERQDMPELIEGLVAKGECVASFPIRENWIDIGQHGDYERANQEALV